MYLLQSYMELKLFVEKAREENYVFYFCENLWEIDEGTSSIMSGKWCSKMHKLQVALDVGSECCIPSCSVQEQQRRCWIVSQLNFHTRFHIKCLWALGSKKFQKSNFIPAMAKKSPVKKKGKITYFCAFVTFKIAVQKKPGVYFSSICPDLWGTLSTVTRQLESYQLFYKISDFSSFLPALYTHWLLT